MKSVQSKQKKTSEWGHWRHFAAVIINFEHNSLFRGSNSYFDQVNADRDAKTISLRKTIWILGMMRQGKHKTYALRSWRQNCTVFQGFKLSLLSLLWSDLIQWWNNGRTISNIASLISMRYGHDVILRISSSLCLDSLSFTYS